MKPIIESTATCTSSIEETSFQISSNREDVLMLLDGLSSGIYSDKVLVVLREYGANAWDANRMAGRGDRPIKVHIPTRQDPTLRIRDYGPGLTKADMVNTFTQYAKSTKRGTNEAVGALGVGAKSGFAYADMFTITSIVPGADENVRLTYSATKDSERGPVLGLMDESLTDDETGVEIAIAVRPQDVYDFTTKAQNLFQHYKPRPVINVELPEEPEEQTVLQHGTIRDADEYKGSQWIGIMGCVPYKVDLGQLDPTQIAKCLTKLSGTVNFAIGEVAFTFSREELRYTQKTKDALVQKLNDLVDEYVVHALTQIDDPKISGWDKRLKLRVLQDMELPLPKEYADLATHYGIVKYDPQTSGFTILHNDSVCTSITISANTRLLIKDTDKPTSHYPYLKTSDYIVKGPGTAADLQKNLEVALKASGLDGIKIALLSSEYYAAPYQKPKKFHNPKHRAKMFVLDAKRSGFSSVRSDNWEAVDRVPEDTDVYVVLTGFEARDADGCNYNFYQRMVDVRGLCKALEIDVPVIHGYKHSDAKPVDRAALKGTEFDQWYAAWFKDLGTKHMARFEEFYWDNPSDHRTLPSTGQLNSLAKDLGEDHAIVAWLRKRINSAKLVGAADAFRSLTYANLMWQDSECCRALRAIEEKYPLIKGDNFDAIWYTTQYGRSRAEMKHWRDYVALIDERIAREKAQERLVHTLAPGEVDMLEGFLSAV